MGGFPFKIINKTEGYSPKTANEEKMLCRKTNKIEQWKKWKGKDLVWLLFHCWQYEPKILYVFFYLNIQSDQTETPEIIFQINSKCGLNTIWKHNIPWETLNLACLECLHSEISKCRCPRITKLRQKFFNLRKLNWGSGAWLKVQGSDASKSHPVTWLKTSQSFINWRLNDTYHRKVKQSHNWNWIKCIGMWHFKIRLI